MHRNLILAVGNDSHLLDTRQLLLEAAGYLVVTASSAREAVDRFLAGNFDLVLLCHSISDKDRDRLACLVRASGSLTPVVTVAGCIGQHDGFATATIGSEPLQLLTEIRNVLNKQQQTRTTQSASGKRKHA